MSALSLSQYLQSRRDELCITNSDIAQRAKISRQTWYKLLNADIEEAKLSTLIRVASALEVEPIELINLYFTGAVRSKVKSKLRE